MKFPPNEKYPKVVYIKNEAYKVKFTRRIKHYGDTCSVTKVIRIRDGMSKRETFKTFLHELLHAISFEGPRKVRLKHKLVYALEDALFEVLIDNFFEDSK